MKQYKDSLICSAYVCRMTMSKISTFDGIKLYDQQAICLPMWTWKDCTVKTTGLCSVSDFLFFVRPRNCSKQWSDKFFTTEYVCKISNSSDDENSKLQSRERSCGERNSHQESRKERMPTLRWKWESVLTGRHVDIVRKETHVVSVMTDWRKETLCGGQMKTIVLTRSKFQGQDWRRGRESSKTSGNTDESSPDRQSEIPCRHKNCKNPSCNFWHSPVCQNCTSETRCKFWKNMFLQTCRGWGEAQQEVKERWCERISCTIEGVYASGLCFSRFSPEKIQSTWRRKIGIKTRRQILQGHLAPKKEKKGVHRKVLSESVRLMSVVVARQFSGKITWGDFAPRKMRPLSSMGFGKNITNSRMQTKLRFVLLLKPR